MSDSTFNPFAGGEIALTAPTTGPQQEIWLAIRLGGREANLAYNESLSVQLSGSIDPSALRRCVEQLVARHEALRTTFSPDGETLTVAVEGTAPWRFDDLSDLAEPERASKKQALIAEEMESEFDLVNGPLFRARLIVLGPAHSELVLTAHHLVCDGWSAGVLVSELPALYRAVTTGSAVDLPPAPRFSDYAVASREGEAQWALAEAERYWFEVLGKAPGALDLPADKPRPPDRRLDAERIDHLLPLEQLTELRRVAKELNASLATLLLAAFDALLYRLTRQSDFAVAMPMAGQADSGEYGLVGHCVNTVPLRCSFDPSAPFAEHVATMKRQLLDAATHQRLSFGDLLRKLELPRDPSRVPLTPVIFNIDPMMDSVKIGGAETRYRTNPRVSENFELFLNGAETEAGLALELTFSRALFEANTVRGWLSEYEQLLRSVARDPKTPLERLEVLPAKEKRYLLEELNRTELQLPPFATALQLIEAQIHATPTRIAVRDARRALTYAELNEHANALAKAMLDAGVSEGDCVGVCLSRGVLVPVALLAVWKVGAAYVPLDPEYPAARLEFVAEDANLRIVLVEPALDNVLSRDGLLKIHVDERLGRLAESPCRRGNGETLAYVIHTSGSTGKPKGVQIEQRSFLNMLASLQRWPGMSPEEVLVAVITLSFDMAGVEMFLPLSVGAQIVIADRDTTMDGRRLANLLDESGATTMQATPVTWRLLVESGWRGIQGFRAFTGGEPLSKDLAQALLERVAEVWNLYGPTETTVYGTGTRVLSADHITIGGAVANSTAYILDELLQPVPRGALGELYIGGAAVGRGYLNRPDLTQERFLPDPFGVQGSTRMYKTGDLARWDTEGRVFYEGRNDNQVKLRGFRIELGEIEVCVGAMPEVRHAVVSIKEFGPTDQRLVAYVVPATAGAEITQAALQAHVRGALPNYMVPHHVVVLEQLPLTPNGKIDRRALPHPGDSVGDIGAHVEPRTDTERRLAVLWKEQLRVAKASVTAGFFEMGGHSMLAVRMLARIRETFGVDLPIRTIFQAQTIEALALLIDASLVQASDMGPSSSVEEIEF